jgi:hypothetical protein
MPELPGNGYLTSVSRALLMATLRPEIVCIQMISPKADIVKAERFHLVAKCLCSVEAQWTA